MEEKSIIRIIKKGSQRMIQHNLIGAPDNRLKCSKFISVYRVSLVKDENISFGQGRLERTKKEEQAKKASNDSD